MCSAIFSLSGFVFLTFVLLFSQLSVASFDFCVFFLSVFSSLFIAFNEFSIFSFFWSFPSVEGPHSDILSRTRLSVFLRISFGISSSSSRGSRLEFAAGRAPWELAVPLALAVPLSGNPWCTASFSEPPMTASPSGSPSEV